MFQKLSSSVLAGSVLIGTSLATAFLATSAQAHIRLEEPLARHPITNFDTGIKSCPCGAGGSNRTCDVARDGSDPVRSTERVSRFEAGSTITLRFNEYVDHVGRYRVAFDPDGADMADFNANILEDIPDPAGPGNEPWEIEVRLPNMTCSNCTLQLVQAMNNDTVNEVLDPATMSSYYTCVDLELVAPGTLGEDDGMEPAPTPTDPAVMVDDMTDVEDDAMDDGSAMNAGTPQDRPLPTVPGMDSAGSTPSPAAGTEMGAAEMVAMNGAPGTATPAFNTNGTGSGSSNSSAGGCSVGAPGPRAAGSFALLGLLAAICLRWRKPRHERVLSAHAL